MDGVAAKKAILDRYNELMMNYSDETADEMTALQDEIEAQGPVGPRFARSSRRWTPCAARRTTAVGRQALGRRAPPRRAVQAAARAARPPAPRRADQPSRRRDDRLARRASARLSGRDPDRHPRPLLPRQRHRLDSRARPRPRHPLRGQLLGLARAEAEAPGAGRPRGRGAPAHASSASASGFRPRPKARQAKSKARIQRYEDLVQGRTREAPTTAQIVIPIAERLGNNVIEFDRPDEGLSATSC